MIKTPRTPYLVLLAAACLPLPCAWAGEQPAQDPIAVARSVIKADRQAVVTEALQLTPAESQKFWPLYQEYRAEMDQIGNSIVKLVREYAGYYPNVPEDRAKQMLKDLTDLEKKQVATRAAFLKKFGKVLPADKNLRFAQVENRLDLALRLEMAASIPLVPVEGRMAGASTGTASFAEGVPGGVTVQTYQVTATVAAIDKTGRKFTLVNADGIKKTLKAGPEVINFDQIQVGDQLKVTAAEQLVVQMADPGSSRDDGAAAMVALAPKGAKPGGLIAETTQVTARITALDLENRSATLQFEDGAIRTFPVRNDIDLAKRKVGEQVVFRLTEALAISVEKP